MSTFRYLLTDAELAEFEFWIYDIFDIAKQEYLLPTDRAVMCADLGLKHVPVAPYWQILDGELEEQIKEADGFSMLNARTIREGLVFKNTKTQESFKVISNNFLEKQH